MSLANETDLLDLARSFQRSRTLLTAVELDVFTALEATAGSTSQVAARIQAEPVATGRLLHALCSLGLLSKSGGVFENTALSRRHLVADAPEPLSLLYVAHQWENWSLLTEAVSTGRMTVVRPFQDPPAEWLAASATRMRRSGRRIWKVVRRSDEWLRAFVGFMRDHARVRARIVTGMLDLSNVERVLDIGGGPAVYAEAFVRANDGLRVTVFDRPDVVPKTRRNVAAAGMAARIDAVGGDFLHDDLGSGFGVVLISETIHAVGPEDNRRLVAHAVAALDPGGLLAIQDFILEDDRTGPEFAALFSLDMLVTTRRGDTYTRSEVCAWMREAGLEGIEVQETGVGTRLITGRVPSA